MPGAAPLKITPVLDPVERASETVLGVLVALTFTGSLLEVMRRQLLAVPVPSRGLGAKDYAPVRLACSVLWRSGFAMAAIGAALVAIIIALGG